MVVPAESQADMKTVSQFEFHRFPLQQSVTIGGRPDCYGLCGDENLGEVWRGIIQIQTPEYWLTYLSTRLLAFRIRLGSSYRNDGLIRENGKEGWELSAHSSFLAGSQLMISLPGRQDFSTVWL